MINHFRTWLANISSSSSPLAGEELIDPSFQPVPFSVMPQDLKDVRQILFGQSTPSSALEVIVQTDEVNRDIVNVKLAVYVAIIHQAGFDKETIKKDTRITYLPDGSGVFGADLASSDKDHAVANTFASMINVPSSFFDTYPPYQTIWLDSQQPPINKMAALLLMTAIRTEAASGGIA